MSPFKSKMHIPAAAAVSALLAASPVMAQEYTMTLAHTLADTSHPLYQAFERMIETIETESDGRIEVRHMAGGALGGDREGIESLMLGDVQFVPVSTAPVVSFVPGMAVFDLPYIFPQDTATLRNVLNHSEFTQTLSEVLADSNIHLGNFFNAGFRQLTTVGVEVAHPDDLAENQLRIRVQENPYHVELWESLGAAPTPISFPELYGALQQGVVDGQENPFGHILSQRFYEVQDYMTVTNHILLANVNLISKEWYDSLPADLQEVIDNALADAEEFQWALQDEMTQAQLDEIAEHMTVVELSDDALEAFRERASGVETSIRAAAGDDLVDALMTSIEQAESTAN